MHHRISFLDFFKAIATQGIVFHHLVSYGFIAELMVSQFPLIRELLFSYGRILVQIFFVLGGFLVSSKISNQTHIFKEIIKRYFRLTSPYFIALFLVIITSTFIKFILGHYLEYEDWTWLSNIQSFVQLISHIFLLHDILSQENLSTGVWYVAIDFQLFILSMILVLIFQKFNRSIMMKVLYLMIFISLFLIPKDYDMWGIYFFNSYGLGILLYQIRLKKNFNDFLIISLLFIFANFYDFRLKIMFSYLFFVCLFIIIKLKLNYSIFYNKFILFLSKNSYSVFLTHFIFVMLANLFVYYFYSFFYSYNLILFLLFFTWIVSILFGQIFFIYVEKQIIKKFLQH